MELVLAQLRTGTEDSMNAAAALVAPVPGADITVQLAGGSFTLCPAAVHLLSQHSDVFAARFRKDDSQKHVWSQQPVLNLDLLQLQAFKLALGYVIHPTSLDAYMLQCTNSAMIRDVLAVADYLLIAQLGVRMRQLCDLIIETVPGDRAVRDPIFRELVLAKTQWHSPVGFSDMFMQFDVEICSHLLREHTGVSREDWFYILQNSMTQSPDLIMSVIRQCDEADMSAILLLLVQHQHLNCVVQLMVGTTRTLNFDMDGTSPLFEAILHGGLDMVVQLVMLGANVSLSALNYAMDLRHDVIAKYLAEHGATQALYNKSYASKVIQAIQAD